MRISGGTPDEQAQIISAQLAGCNNELAPFPQGIKSEVHFSTGQGGDILLDENSYHQFTQVLKTYLEAS